MAPTTPTPINPSLILQTEAGNGGTAGAVAVATSAAKRGGKKAPGSPKISKVSNNFMPSIRCNPGRVAKQNGMSKSEVAGGSRNAARGAKLDGGVVELEAAGESPRKKPQDHSPRKKP